jgi:tetratricopeptide (TPR) repeat protein
VRLAAALLALATFAAADAIDIGRKLLNGPQHEDGVALIREGIAILEKAPATAKTLHRIGLGHFYLEEDAKAKAAFARAAELDPKDPEHVFMLGVVQMYSDPVAATATMRKAIEIGPADARFRFELGRLLARQERYDEALAALLDACRLDPKHAEAHLQAATLFLGAGRDEEALAHLRSAVEADETLLDAWYNLGQVHYNGRRFEKSLEAWTKAAELAPDDFQLRTKLVQAHYALGRYADAEPHRKRVLELRPKDRTEFCFDQFDAGANRVFAYETFDKGGDLYSHFVFKVTDPKGEISRTVNLESSAVIREMGAMYILCANLPGGEHRNYGIQWKEMPPYGKLKELVVKAANGELD